MPHDENRTLFVAKFRDHPKGPDRYVKDFKWWPTHNQPWWNDATEETRHENIAFFLQHEQYHFSTDQISQADMIYTDSDRELVSKYLDVDFLPATITHTPIGDDGWQQWNIEAK